MHEIFKPTAAKESAMNNTFKAIIATAALITLAGASATASAHGRFGLNIMIGAPAYAYAPPPAYAYAPAPAYACSGSN